MGGIPGSPSTQRVLVPVKQLQKKLFRPRIRERKKLLARNTPFEGTVPMNDVEFGQELE